MAELVQGEVADVAFGLPGAERQVHRGKPARLILPPHEREECPCVVAWFEQARCTLQRHPHVVVAPRRIGLCGVASAFGDRAVLTPQELDRQLRDQLIGDGRDALPHLCVAIPEAYLQQSGLPAHLVCDYGPDMGIGFARHRHRGHGAFDVTDFLRREIALERQVARVRVGRAEAQQREYSGHAIPMGHATPPLLRRRLHIGPGR